MDLVAAGQHSRLHRFTIDIGAVEAADVDNLEFAVFPSELGVPTANGDVVEENVAAGMSASGCDGLIEQEPRSRRWGRASRRAAPNRSTTLRLPTPPPQRRVCRGSRRGNRWWCPWCLRRTSGRGPCGSLPGPCRSCWWYGIGFSAALTLVMGLHRRTSFVVAFYRVSASFLGRRKCASDKKVLVPAPPPARPRRSGGYRRAAHHPTAW